MIAHVGAYSCLCHPHSVNQFTCAARQCVALATTGRRYGRFAGRRKSRFSSCTQGVLHEDTAPLPIVDDSGTPAPGTRSLWQTDAIALRMTLRASYGLRGTGLVQMVQGVTW
jgi:hypothetical protein